MRKPYEPPTPHYWTYELAPGWEAWAGKTDADNDILSLRTAKPEELWFHASAVPGSHVILHATEEDHEPPSKELILAAAAVAAYHSKARNAGMTPVVYTQAKHVGKERGAKPGSVIVKRETIVKVRPALPGKTE